MDEFVGRLPGARGGRDDDDLEESRERRSRLRDSAVYKDPKLDSPTRLSKSLGLLKSQRRPQREPKRKPEVHVIGEIVGGTGFGSGVACKWRIERGTTWDRLEGEDHGQSQTDYPMNEEGMAVWAHPIDVHFGTFTMEGWPRICLEIYKLDDYCEF